MHIKRKKLVDPVVIRVACFCFCFGNTLDCNFDRNYRTYKLLWYKGQAWIIKSGRPRLKVEEPDKKSSGKTKSEGVNWLVRFFFSVINKTKGTLSQQNGEPAPLPLLPHCYVPFFAWFSGVRTMTSYPPCERNSSSWYSSLKNSNNVWNLMKITRFKPDSFFLPCLIAISDFWFTTGMSDGVSSTFSANGQIM